MVGIIHVYGWPATCLLILTQQTDWTSAVVLQASSFKMRGLAIIQAFITNTLFHGHVVERQTFAEEVV